MIYTKVSFIITPDNEINREILVAVLSQTEFESFDETDESVEAFWPGENFTPEAVIPLIQDLNFDVEMKDEIIPDQNWNEVWEKNYFKPLLIAEKCLVRAPFHTEYPEAEYEIIIEPNMAFGTGNHETTSLMAEEILKLDVSGKTVLDMGCGTGILAILASMRGAEKVTAIDIDHWAFEGTVENARVNKIANIEAALGDASLLVDQQFDIIFANIQKNIVMRDLPVYNNVLKPGGQILLSGFYKNDVPDVRNVAEGLKLKQIGLQEKNNWVVNSYQKAAD
ncbi:MAG: ribosomal protein L11 methyltransferase [Bacteroidetes bacterium GWF2_42_66]|nr:MAG: ribosomal protein L11 methyltransferase [Bacteroidetes bacterium GWA2_42_15]OFX96342.1 MAG: ribosomal protein L11 methyltransferase [Bacteroidetes bacterium GWE2_42_39]OFY46381.1 MAG: ribosomal protein L11 methyltransferase [Bacteroidetes bacterium GWF2_42_66]HBL78233.1 50S ribosomal protein L11 methyltransferase [Prolixibacteraceae bacterium]HCU60161.1 50S ribosomal protein L11 methyltransferase [Prolixibacteraceae bacterium]